MILHWPQLTYLTLLLLGVGISLAKDGEPTTENGIATLIGAVVAITLLYFGGFFNAN